MLRPLMALHKAICLGIAAAILAACGCNASGSSFFTNATVPPNAQGAVSNTATGQRIPIPFASCCDIAIDPGIDRIYLSSGTVFPGKQTTVVDGKTLTVVATVSGFGGAENVDTKTHNVWLVGFKE